MVRGRSSAIRLCVMSGLVMRFRLMVGRLIMYRLGRRDMMRLVGRSGRTMYRRGRAQLCIWRLRSMRPLGRDGVITPIAPVGPSYIIHRCNLQESLKLNKK
jgi:hypothetical protein